MYYVLILALGLRNLYKMAAEEVSGTCEMHILIAVLSSIYTDICIVYAARTKYSLCRAISASRYDWTMRANARCC